MQKLKVYDKLKMDLMLIAEEKGIQSQICIIYRKNMFQRKTHIQY